MEGVEAVPYWVPILLAALIGIFSAFQAWSGLALVSLIRQVGKLEGLVEGRDAVLDERHEKAEAAHEDHEGRLRQLERRRQAPQH